MKANYLHYPKYFFLFLTFILIFSCGKEPDTIGLDLVDENKPFVGFDTTLSVVVYSAREDSVISDETSVDPIGSMQTSTFGRTNASRYTHLRLSQVYPEWGPNPIADSVIFSLVYDTAYGNILTAQTFKIFRVTEDFYIDSTYYSNAIFAYDEAQLYASHSFVPDLTKIEVVDTTGDENDTTYLAAILNIPIDPSFAEYIFSLDTSFLSSSEKFISEFKGIYIRPDEVNAAGEGAILTFNLLSERSKLTIYYHNDTTDSLSFNFTINLNSARVGRYEHRYELSQDPVFIEQIVNNDTTKGNTRAYLQGLGGVKTVVHVPGLMEWAGAGNITINEAKLMFRSMDYPAEYEPPQKLLLFKYTAAKQLAFTYDYEYSESFYGGNYNLGSQSYYFRISLEAQKILNNESFFGFVMFPNAKSIRANELVMYGTDTAIPGHFYLEVTYTEIK